jgi:hypothetical protein
MVDPFICLTGIVITVMTILTITILHYISPLQGSIRDLREWEIEGWTTWQPMTRCCSWTV